MGEGPVGGFGVAAEDDELGSRSLLDRLLTPLNRLASKRFLREARRKVWHNTDELIVTPAQTAQTLTGMVARIKDREYAERQLVTFPGGFVQQHVLKGKRVHDDGEVRLPCAIICKVKDGKITRLDEYFDSAHVAEFRKFANA